MAGFLVEDGTGLALATSFCSVAFSDTYHAKKFYTASIWSGVASNTAKENLLMEATETIVREVADKFLGTPTTTTQALPFPRVGVPDLIKYVLASNEIPVCLKQATAELAARIKEKNLDKEPTKGIQSVGVGQNAVAVTFDNDNDPEVLIRSVFNYLRPLLRNRGGGAFGKAVR